MFRKVLDNYWLKSGIINVFQNFSNVILGFASFYFLVRVLESKHDFGTWGIYLSTTTIMEIFRNGLVQNALIKYLSSSDKAEHSKIVTSSFAIGTLLTLICIVLNLLFGHILAQLFNAPELTTIFYLYNIVYLFSGVLNQFCCIEQANFQYTGVFASTLVRNLAFLSFLLYAFFSKSKVEMAQLVYVQIVSAVLSLIASWYYVRPFLVYRYQWSSSWLKKLFDYGKYSFGNSISSILSGTIDKWMLAALFSPAASATFEVAVKVVNLVDIPTSALATIVFPQSARRMETDGKEAIKYLYEKSMGTLMAILIPAVLVIYIFNDFFIDLLAGDEYSDVVPVLNVALIYCLLIPYGRQFGSILDSIGKTRTTFIIVVFTATLNLTLNFFFIRRMGVIGAAYATLISNVIGFVVAQIILRRELGVNVFNTFIYAYMFYPEFLNKYILRREVH